MVNLSDAPGDLSVVGERSPLSSVSATAAVSTSSGFPCGKAIDTPHDQYKLEVCTESGTHDWKRRDPCVARLYIHKMINMKLNLYTKSYTHD